MNQRSRRWVRVGLVVLILVAAVRLALWITFIANHLVQSDFCIFYTAGESVRAGVSPYLNQRFHLPPIWDGGTPYVHSNYLYPPLATDLFSLVAAVPYHAAKSLWMLMGLCCLAASIWLIWRFLPPMPLEYFLAAIAAALFLYPLLVELERGQDDLLTLVLFCGAIVTMYARRRSDNVIAGCFLAAATLMKLHLVFLGPFLLLQRRWTTLLAFGAAGIMLLALSLALDGPTALGDYLHNQLPRISRYGPDAVGAQDILLWPDGRILPIDMDHPIKGDRQYDWVDQRIQNGLGTITHRLAHGINALQARVGSVFLRRVLGLFSMSVIAIVLGGGAWTMMAMLFARHSERLTDDRLWHATYWFAVATVLLLIAPLTWRGHEVWLIPVWLVLAGWHVRGASGHFFWLAVAGLMILTTPLAGPDLPPPIAWALERRDVPGELLVAIGLIALLYRAARMRQVPARMSDCEQNDPYNIAVQPAAAVPINR